jgi:hypothetical protein
MTTRRGAVGWFLVLGFSVALACSNQGNGTPVDGGAGGAAADTRFACGDASCTLGQEYCIDLTNPHGGASGSNDSGAPEQIRSCRSFGACAAHDCTCIPNCFCGDAPDGGGTLAFCGPI